MTTFYDVLCDDDADVVFLCDARFPYFLTTLPLRWGKWEREQVVQIIIQMFTPFDASLLDSRKEGKEERERERKWERKTYFKHRVVYIRAFKGIIVLWKERRRYKLLMRSRNFGIWFYERERAFCFCRHDNKKLGRESRPWESQGLKTEISNLIVKTRSLTRY